MLRKEEARLLEQSSPCEKTAANPPLPSYIKNHIYQSTVLNSPKPSSPIPLSYNCAIKLGLTGHPSKLFKMWWSTLISPAKLSQLNPANPIRTPNSFSLQVAPLEGFLCPASKTSLTYLFSELFPTFRPSYLPSGRKKAEILW